MFDKVRFELTKEHLKLINRMNVNYNDCCGFGAPEIDPKRPYGKSQVYNDIGDILGIEPETGDPEDAEFSERQQEEMLALHKQTATALQVILASGSFEAGTYEAEQYRRNWKKL